MARPKKVSGEVRVPVSAALLPNVVQDLDSIASRTDRSRSQVVEKLILRGLAAYNKDKLLDDSSPDHDDQVILKENDMAEIKANANKARFDVLAAPPPAPYEEDILVDDNFDFDGEEGRYINEEGHLIHRKTGKRIRDLRIEKDYIPKPSYAPPNFDPATGKTRNNDD